MNLSSILGGGHLLCAGCRAGGTEGRGVGYLLWRNTGAFCAGLAGPEATTREAGTVLALAAELGVGLRHKPAGTLRWQGLERKNKGVAA